MRTSLLVAAILAYGSYSNLLPAQSGHVGIGVDTPQARLHIVGDLLVADTFNTSDPADPPASGPGTRMMWYPDKAAFRAGRVTGGEWDMTLIGPYSTAFGLNTRASGGGAIAFGAFTRAEANAGLAIGRYNVGGGSAGNWILADPLFEVGMGTDSANRKNAMTIFKNAGALWGGEYNGASPAAPPATGPGTRMMWYPDKAAFRAGKVYANTWDKDSIGGYSFATGNSPMAKGDASAAFGSWTEAIGEASTAMGADSKAIGSGSLALGYYTIAEAHLAVSMGRYNVGGGNPTTWIATDPLFEIGFGNSSGNRANAMTIYKNAGAFWGGAYTPTPATPPISGAGTRMMWYPDKAAFRAGIVSGSEWDQANVGVYSMAWGYNTTASAIAAMAMGYSTTASGSYSTAIGYNTTASGLYATAMGYSAIASGSYSTATGHGSTSSGSRSTAMGYGTTASGQNSTAMGQNTTAEAYNSLAIGRYNVGGGVGGSWLVSDPLFEVGIGTGPGTNDRANALTVLKNGKIGLGTATPDEVLHVEGTIEVDQKIQANDAGGLEFATDEGTTRLAILDDGDVGIGTASPAAGARLHIYGGDLRIEETEPYVYLNATNSTGNSGVVLQQAGATKGSFYYDESVDALVVKTPAAEYALAISPENHVGLGTVSPGAHRLVAYSTDAGAAGSTGYFLNGSSNGIALSVENLSSSSSDNVLLVTSKGSTGDLASFDSWHGTGTWDREFRFTNNGDGRCDGSWITGGADYAEFFPMAYPDRLLEPGDVIAISEARGYSVEKATAATRRLVLGVYSTMPAVIGNSSAEEDPEDAALVGLIGVVPAKVCLEHGPIRIGDFVTISSMPGVAARAVTSGLMIGRAMENFEGPGQGMIKVLVDIGQGTINDSSEMASLRAEIRELKAMISGTGSR